MNTQGSVHIIDCDANPYIPDKRWKVVNHRQLGMLEWNPVGLSLSHLTIQERCEISWSSKNVSLIKFGTMEKVEKGQRGADSWMIGHYYISLEKLRLQIEAAEVLNANVLDYLIAHPELIPEEWKKIKGIIFYGTVYKFGGECVRFLRWRAGKWDWNFIYIDGWWGFDFRGTKRYFPSAILKNS